MLLKFKKNNQNKHFTGPRSKSVTCLPADPGFASSLFRQNNTIFFLNYKLTSLDMYNGLSQVYCIKPEGRIH